MIELVRKRRSIRQFAPVGIEKDKIALLEETVLRAPTSRNFKPTHFIFVHKRELIEALAKSKQHGSAFLSQAPLCVVVCADESASDVWVEDASIASSLLQLSAQSLGLGSCWIQIRKRMHDEQQTAEAYVKESLGLSFDNKVECLIAIGYADEEKKPITLSEEEKKRVTSIE